MSITTVSQSQLGQDTAKNSQVVTTVIKNFNSGTLGSGPSITSVVVTDSSYNNLDDAAVTTSNGYIKIIGTGFTSTANVYIGSSAVPAANVTFVSSTEIRARVPVLSVGNYSLSLFNSNSSGTISSSTFIVSTGPAWVTGATLSNQASGTPFNVSLSATSDSSVTYANTSALPAGTTLAANGYFSGTVTTGTQTTYTFDVKATDVENQDNTRTFSLTVTVTPLTRLWSWGSGGAGQLGQNNLISRSSPVQIGSQTTWNNVSGGKDFTLATKTDGTLWAWGGHNLGRLGTSDVTDRSSPTQIGTNTNWNLIGTGNYHSLATKTDGTLWAWGFNAFGMLGLNITAYRSSPTQVGTGTNWLSIGCIGYHSLATKTDGTLWSWGINDSGQLGQNNTIYRSSPTQVGTLTNWSVISGGFRTTFVTKTDGTLWAWGRNGSGELGLNTVTFVSSPVQVAGTNWLKVKHSPSPPPGAHTLAIKTNGTLWLWGDNTYGHLGLNDLVSRSSPTQVGTGTNWSDIAGGLGFSAATKTDGTLWTWGTNGAGQLALGDTARRSSPTQVGTGTNWSKVNNLVNSMNAITAN
jgi:alpha-tubulin suppressor-like RCC1 family protein